MTMPDTFEADDQGFKHLADLRDGDVFAADWTFHHAHIVQRRWHRGRGSGPNGWEVFVAGYPRNHGSFWKGGGVTVRHLGRDVGLTQAADDCTVQDNPQANRKEPDMESIMHLCEQALLTDGAHHKQWYLEQVAELAAGGREQLEAAFAANGVYFEEGKHVSAPDDDGDVWTIEAGIAP